MSRRSEASAARAAEQASEAARVLAERGHQVRGEKPAETVAERAPDTYGDLTPERAEKLKAKRSHVLAMEDIAKRRGLEPDPAPEAEKKDAKDEKPAAAPKQEPEKHEPAAQEPAAEPAAETVKTVRVKVDGEEYDAPAADVEAEGGIHAYQRNKAAENRLKKANEALAEAKRLAAQWAEQQQAAAKPKEPEQTDAEFLKAKANQIRFGSDEEFAAALQEILQRTNKAVDPNSIIEQATARIRHDQAVAEFDKEFADLVKNPILLRTIVSERDDRLRKLRESGFKGPVDWKDFYFKIGNEVRSVVARPSQPAGATKETPGSPSQPSDKEARKASIVNLPTAAARAEGPKEEKALTPDEERKQAIAELRRKRGQAS